MDRVAWQVTVYGVTQSQTRLKQLGGGSILVLASYLVRKKHNYIISKGKLSIKIVSTNQPSCVCVCVCVYVC